MGLYRATMAQAFQGGNSSSNITPPAKLARPEYLNGNGTGACTVPGDLCVRVCVATIWNSLSLTGLTDAHKYLLAQRSSWSLGEQSQECP